VINDTEAALLAAIRAAPDDDAPRLVYADWLTERGDARGAMIVAQCESKSGALVESRALPAVQLAALVARLPSLIRRDTILLHRGFPVRVDVTQDHDLGIVLELSRALHHSVVEPPLLWFRDAFARASPTLRRVAVALLSYDPGPTPAGVHSVLLHDDAGRMLAHRDWCSDGIELRIVFARDERSVRVESGSDAVELTVP
jgi:uncharacterized protein (TIGR02996 family)